jgi:hypothetical protein
VNPARTGGRETRYARRIVPHPLLFAAYPVLFLFGQRFDEVAPGELWLPLGVALLGGAVTYALAGRLLGSERGAILASAIVFVFFAFGRVANRLAPYGIDGGMVLAASGVGLAAVAVVLLRRRTGWERVTRAANVVGAAVVVIALSLIAADQVTIGSGTLLALEPLPRGGPPATGPAQDRDIYFIILDRYGSEHVLRTYEGVADPLLYRRLPELGFTVTSDSLANYPHTIHSVAATLNLSYLDELAAAQGPSGRSTLPLAALIEDNAVGRYLRSRGYTFVQAGSWWEPTATSRIADVVVPVSPTTEFQEALLETTILPQLVSAGRGLDLPVDGGPADHNRRHYEAATTQFAKVEAIRAIPGPKFVFMHILLPHEPYVFGADGSFVDPATIHRTFEDAFAAQLAVTDSHVLPFLASLVAAPPERQPIVILQADEGPQPPRYSADENGFRWEEATPAELDEKFGILSAFFLPGDGAPLPAPDISPVNDFRLVLSAYFGEELPLLPDRHVVFRDRDHPYDLRDATARVLAARAAAGP